MMDDDRRRALSLVEARVIESDTLPSRQANQRSNQILDEVSEDPVALLEAVLDLFDGVVAELRVGFGRVGFDAALKHMAEGTLGVLSDRKHTSYRCRPAQIVQGFTAVNDVTLDGVLRDIGADDYEAAVTVVDEYELIDQTIIVDRHSG